MATTEQIQDLAEKMTQERAELLAALDGIDEQQAEMRNPDADGEDGWSTKEQLAHLEWMEGLYRHWVERALSEERPDLSQGDGPDPVLYPQEQAHDHTVPEHVAELIKQRERTLELIGVITPEQYDRTALSPAFGELSVLQWLRSYYRHDRMHHAQIEGRKSDYTPRFLSGEDPDQRRGG